MNIQTRAINRAATFRKKNPVASRFIAMAKKKRKGSKKILRTSLWRRDLSQRKIKDLKISSNASAINGAATL